MPSKAFSFGPDNTEELSRQSEHEIFLGKEINSPLTGRVAWAILSIECTFCFVQSYRYAQ